MHCADSKLSRSFGLENLEPRTPLAADLVCIEDGGTVEQSDILKSDFVFGSVASEGADDRPEADGNASYDAADAGSTASSATNIGVLNNEQSFFGTVGRWDSADVLRFTLTGAADVNIGLSGLRADIDLAIYDRHGQRIAISDRAGRSAESLSFAGETGVYYIAIVPWRHSFSSYILTTDVSYLDASWPGVDGSIPQVDNPSDDSPSVDPDGADVDSGGVESNTGDPESNDSGSDIVTAFPDVDYYGDTDDWNLNSINAPEVWAQGFTGGDIVVAVIDTGVTMDHSDLDDQIWVNTEEIVGNGIDDDQNGYVDDVYGWDFIEQDGVPNDENGHGTHVAGTIAAEDNGSGATGVAPDATIMSVRVLDENGYGTEYTVAAGIRYAVQNGASIINLSLGGTFSRLIQSAILFAQQQDVLVVIAAGNESAAVPSYPAAFSATFSNVLSVGGYDRSETLATFSNRVGSSSAVQVDAPGVSIYSTSLNQSYAKLSGTSMAAPHVAGLAALALSAEASLSANDLRALIIKGADDDVSRSDSVGGINAAMTVALAVAGSSVSSESPSSAARVTPSATSRDELSQGISLNSLAASTLQLLTVDDVESENAFRKPRLDNRSGYERLFVFTSDDEMAAVDQAISSFSDEPELHNTDSEAWLSELLTSAGESDFQQSDLQAWTRSPQVADRDKNSSLLHSV